MPRNINPLYTPPSDYLSLASSFPKVLFFSAPSSSFFSHSLLASPLPHVKADTVDWHPCHVRRRGIGGLLIQVWAAGYSLRSIWKRNMCLIVGLLCLSVIIFVCKNQKLWLKNAQVLYCFRESTSSRYTNFNVYGIPNPQSKINFFLLSSTSVPNFKKLGAPA